MDVVRKLTTSAKEQRQQEDVLAAIAALRANVDYIAMMTDTDLEDGTEDADTAEASEEE